MSIPAEFIDELRGRVSLIDVIGRRVRLLKRGRDHTGLCPFHNEKTPSFTVSEEKGFFHCFGCGAHGDVVGYVMRAEGLAFPEAVERLAREAGMPVPVSSPAERQRAEQQATLHSVLEAAARFFEKQLQAAVGRPALEYLGRRGVTEETMARFRLGYAPDGRSALKDGLAKDGFGEALMLEAGLTIKPEDGRPTYDRFRGRVMFPITDRRGRVIAFGGRILEQGEPKYLNSPETPLFHKGRVLYGLAQASPAIRETGEVIVCEGYMDVIALAEAGLKAAVAPLGTALTEDQMAELWRLAPEPVLCFDGDNAGQRAAMRAVERALPLLQPGRSLRFAVLPPGEDPDSLVRGQGAGAVRAILDEARPMVDMVWDLELSGRPVDTPERLAGFRRRLQERVRQIGERSVQEAYQQAFARRLAAQSAPPSAATWPGRPQARPGGRYSGPPAPAIGGIAARRGVPDPIRQREDVILALAINHPYLLLEGGEELAQLSFQGTGLDRLKQAVIDHAAAHPDLDAEGLKRHLSQTGFAEAVESLVQRTKDKPFTLPTVPRKDAVAEFRHQLGLKRDALSKVERTAASERMAEEQTDESYARFETARQATLDGEAARRDIDGQDENLPLPV